MLIVKTHFTYKEERSYIIDTILNKFLGLEYNIEFQDRRDILITNESGKELRLIDILFQTPREKWLRPESFPRQPLLIWDLSHDILGSKLISPHLPIIYGRPIHPNHSCSNVLNIDIFGSAFFMLTRYEEMVKSQRDDHGRFPARASLAYQEGFLERPIINEYIEILWAYLKHMWPNLERKKKNFCFYLTHDVDRPFAYLFLSPLKLAQHLGGDIIFRKNPLFAVNRSLRWAKVKLGKISSDPYYTFDLMMDLAERNGLKSSFYFIPSKGISSYEGLYTIRHPRIRCLLQYIHCRGHEIGLHANYFTYRSLKKIREELHSLEKVLEEEKIKQKIKGGRQHYLRWEVPITWQNWDDAGLEYDSTLSFADHVGFRSGICFEYPVFNVLTRKALKLKERPLIVMEGSLLNYMRMGMEDAFNKTQLLKNRCRMFKGDFTLLWHNTQFLRNKDFFEYFNRLLQ